jgi:hypothetical protein
MWHSIVVWKKFRQRAKALIDIAHPMTGNAGEILCGTL